MTGIAAAKQILSDAEKEEFVNADVVARMLRVSRRSLVEDWRRRKRPVQKVGDSWLLPARLVVTEYLSHREAHANVADAHDVNDKLGHSHA